MAEDKSQKTEAPTARRRKEAKEEGNVARTPDLSAWLTIIVFLIVGPAAIDNLRGLFVRTLGQVRAIMDEPSVPRLTEIFRDGMLGAIWVLAPLALGCMTLGSLGHIVQGGMKVYGKRFKPKWKKLNPGPGLKNMFGQQAAWTFAKTLLKFVVFGFVAYQVMRGALEGITISGAWSIGAIISIGSQAALNLLRVVAMVGLAIAALDYGMERRRIEKSLKMTKEEIKKESKQSEGDPQLRAAIKARQREVGRRRMMASVSEASVVMVNPAHVAVALKYVPGEGAPQVVAKGAGHLAARIRQEADVHEIPMVRDVIVARTLYKLCDVGAHIPLELYDAIAHVLAFVFHLEKQGKTAGPHESPIPRPPGTHEDPPEDLSDRALGIVVADPAA
ncbi:MAG: EscU/YscU/HrcU family type III secretion system export apparatus switch protein [Austwickia sp.]|nr:EscU/YscU/HrcU family type III secretion system export apparatus switch protein [Austwickia sp.]